MKRLNIFLILLCLGSFIHAAEVAKTVTVKVWNKTDMHITQFKGEYVRSGSTVSMGKGEGVEFKPNTFVNIPLEWIEPPLDNKDLSGLQGYIYLKAEPTFWTIDFTYGDRLKIGQELFDIELVKTADKENPVAYKLKDKEKEDARKLADAFEQGKKLSKNAQGKPSIKV